MKVLAASLLIGAASARSSPFQHVLQPPQGASEAWTKPLHNLQESLKSLTGEARAVWDEVANLFPKDFDRTSFFSAPKKHTRRPDDYWHHIIKGADVQSVWVENADGEKEREVEGKLEDYSLRTRKVDPSSLGVDPGVKQYSGYLDDAANDKHLFYCTFLRLPSHLLLTDIPNQGSLNPGTTPKMTPSSSGSMVAPAAPPSPASSSSSALPPSTKTSTSSQTLIAGTPTPP